ncbi:acyl-CoA dehydrogenase family protein [Nocardia gamkensis]|uniref:acyl-CoA dehydrogenase family protein n=1 Tax=Nocardia gamkensis TaxID=352869 RepID=UPI0036E9250D
MIPELDLTDEGLMFQANARSFADKVIAPVAQKYWESGEFAYDLLNRLREIGYLGILAREEHGGAGASTVNYMAVLEELARADITTALTLQVHVLVTEVYEQFASPEQQAEWLPRLTSGEILGAIAMTEPGAGSDLRSVATTARQDGTDWVINGSKTFITNAGTDVSDGCVVLTKTGPNEFTTFIVPRKTHGFVTGKKINKLGWRSMDTRELFFEDCRIPAGNMLGERGKGLRVVLTGMDLGRIAFGTCSTGLAQACLDHSLTYATERRQFGRPLTGFQATQFKLADLATKIDAARALSFDAARRRDAGLPREVAASKAKLYASRVCVEAADTAFQIFGGYGFTMDFPIARFYADAKMMEIGEGTSEMQRMFIARALGCPPEPRADTQTPSLATT